MAYISNIIPFIGATKSVNGVFALSPVTLTATAADNRASLQVTSSEQLVLYIRYITGSGETNNVLNMTVEFSPDGTLFYQEATEEASTTTVTEYQATRQFTGAVAATTYSFRVLIPIADIDRIRISFAETGVVTNFGTVSVLAVLSDQHA